MKILFFVFLIFLISFDIYRSIFTINQIKVKQTIRISNKKEIIPNIIIKSRVISRDNTLIEMLREIHIQEIQQIKMSEHSHNVSSNVVVSRGQFVSGDQQNIKNILWTVAKENNLPVYYLYGIAMLETGGTLRSNVVGPPTPYGRALGLMQLLPLTARVMEVNNVWDPYQNATGAAKYLKRLENKYKNRGIKDSNNNVMDPLIIAVIAYGWGETNLDSHLGRFYTINYNYLPRETRFYIKKLSSFYK